jgi:hypothetical protein
MSLPLTNITTKSPLNILNTNKVITLFSHDNCNFYSIETMDTSIKSPKLALTAVQKYINSDTGNPNVL